MNSNDLIVEKPKKRRSCLAWVGHASYVHCRGGIGPGRIIYDTRKEAREAGWKTPSKVKITLVGKKK